MVLLLATALTCSSCGGEQPFASATVKKLNQLVDAIMKQANIPGVVVGVWVPGEGAWVEAKGKADVETGEEMGTDYKFRIGSITKTFTATVVLQLVDEGRIGLDDPVSKYLEGIRRGEDMTVRQLLNHTSGMYSHDEGENEAVFNAAIVAEPGRDWDPEEFMDMGPRSNDPFFEPGTEWRYSNGAYMALGLIVEKVTGDTLEEQIEEKIIDPLGLENTSLPDTAEITPPFAHGYTTWTGAWEEKNRDRLIDWTELGPGWAWAAGGMVSDMEDMKTWAKALATGELLSEKTQEERLEWIDVPGGETLGAKYGLGIYYLGGLIGHDGDPLAYNCATYYYPEQDATIVVMYNKGMNEVDGQYFSADMPTVMGIATLTMPDENWPWMGLTSNP